MKRMYVCSLNSTMPICSGCARYLSRQFGRTIGGGRISVANRVCPNPLEKTKIFAISALLFALLFAFQANAAADAIDPEASKVVRSMSDFMDGLTAYSVEADIDNEVVDFSGRKIQLSSRGAMTVQRPGSLYMERTGSGENIALIFDGKTMTIHGKDRNFFFQAESPGDVDHAIDVVRDDMGLDAPGADLFHSSPYDDLMDGVVVGSYMGTGYVNGVECHYVFFRQAQVDWQMWVAADGDPLPMKYVITTKWMTGAPQYSIRLRNWKTNPVIEKSRFQFKAPEGALKLERIATDELGEILIEEEVK